LFCLILGSHVLVCHILMAACILASGHTLGNVDVEKCGKITGKIRCVFFTWTSFGSKI
jgi:hypothetical protein